MANFKKATAWIHNDGSIQVKDITSMDAAVALRKDTVDYCELVQEIPLEDGSFVFYAVEVDTKQMADLLNLYYIDEGKIECEIRIYRKTSVLSVRFK